MHTAALHWVTELKLSDAYERLVLPRLTDWACGFQQIAEQRRRIVPQASGRVLELGVGSGLNIAYYDRFRVEELLGLDPSCELLKLAEGRAADAPFPVTFLNAPGEAIPLGANTVDAVVSTYTLCTVADPAQALEEVARVLTPGGRLLFAEHGKANDPAVLKWQTRLTPAWKRLAGGCHLDRDIPALIEAAGLQFLWMERGYIRGPKFLTFNLVGVART